MLYSLLNIQVKTLIAVLFWGNLTSIILIFSYRYVSRRNLKSQWRSARYYSLAKLCQAGAFFFLFFRGVLPDLASVNLGNNLLFIGFYLEAGAMLIIAQGQNKKSIIMVTAVLAAALLVFNGVEFMYPYPSVRIVTASICVFFILGVPAVRMLLLPDISGFKRMVGVLYLIFTLLQLPRGFYALENDIDILTNAFIQSLTFLSLVVLMVFGLSAYLLLMKEDADKIIAALASTDTLTELPNRRGFLDIARRHFERRQRTSSPLSVLFLDIDHFKSVNDTYGHGFGDEVLVALADTIRKTLRVGDLSCRYGGEEFVLLLPDTDMAQASIAAQRLLDAVRQTAFERRPDFSFTVSIGIMGGVPGQEDTLADFLEKADKALYCAKENGRNRMEEYLA
ncbi:MAG: GGDEF domain-containing protein [Spirochaetales bacterium]|jgi:diguanylate cyclase (GGDEF)-like protein|nr:GGDEF domain-containing protein [Spirochaetales bacterium]